MKVIPYELENPKLSYREIALDTARWDLENAEKDAQTYRWDLARAEELQELYGPYEKTIFRLYTREDKTRERALKSDSEDTYDQIIAHAERLCDYRVELQIELYYMTERVKACKNQCDSTARHIGQLRRTILQLQQTPEDTIPLPI